MPENTETPFKQPRDKYGHFVKASSSVSAPDVKTIPEFEKPIVSVSINNPLKKIMYWLNEIRKHQTTTLAFKLSIPLVVVPVIVAAAFSLGRVSGLGFNFPEPISHPPADYASPSPAAPVNLSKAGTLKIAKSATNVNYLLSLRNGEIVILEVPATLDLTKYGNKQILVTGAYSKSNNTLKVSEIAQIEVYNSVIVPESTKSAK